MGVLVLGLLIVAERMIAAGIRKNIDKNNETRTIAGSSTSAEDGKASGGMGDFFFLCAIVEFLNKLLTTLPAIFCAPSFHIFLFNMIRNIVYFQNLRRF